MSAVIDSHLQELIDDYVELVKKYPAAFVHGDCNEEMMSSDDQERLAVTRADIDLAIEDENDEFQQGVGVILDAVIAPVERNACVFNRLETHYEMQVVDTFISEQLPIDADPEDLFIRWESFVIANE